MAEEKWRILGKLMNTHDMQAHLHSHKPPTHFPLIFVRDSSPLLSSPLPSLPFPPILSSPLSLTSQFMLWLILYHRVRIYLTARVRSPNSRLVQKHANTITPNIHTQTRQRKQAPCPFKWGSQGLVACSWRLLPDYCDPAILAERSQDISAQR